MNGYYLWAGKCEKLSTLPNCERATNEKCLLCNVGYYKTFDGKCLSCEKQHCDLCFGPNEICSCCEDGYKTQRDGSCGITTCGQSNFCEVCSQGGCLKCLYGYYFKNSTTCDACSNLVEDCVSCNSKLKKCVECKYGFRLSADGLSCDKKTENVEELRREMIKRENEEVTDKDTAADYGDDDDDDKINIDDWVDQDSTLIQDKDLRDVVIGEDEDEDEEDFEKPDDENQEDEDEAKDDNEDKDKDEDEVVESGDESVEDVEKEPDPTQFVPKDSWGFDVLKDNATYYSEVEVQLHVSHTIYHFYLAAFENNHTHTFQWIHKKFLAGYNFLGWAFNRLIVDDIGEDKFFVELIPWELMIYVDNYPIAMKTKRQNSKRNTNPGGYIQRGVVKSWSSLMKRIREQNGATADRHMYFSKSGFGGSTVGIAIGSYGVGMDKAGVILGHEVGHTIGMPDATESSGSEYMVTFDEFGTKGSYYSKYRTYKIKRKVTKKGDLKKSTCRPTDLVDGRRIGRIQLNQPFYHAFNDTRDSICKQYMGDNCYALEEGNKCKDVICHCKNKHGDIRKVSFKTMIRGLPCGENKVCYDKKCASIEMMRWNEAYSVDKAECRYDIPPNIIDKAIFPNYKCLDSVDNVCVFGRDDFIIGDVNPFYL